MSENIKIKSGNNGENEFNELTQEESDLYDLFINEYNDLFENVLNLKGKNLYTIIKHNVFLLLGKSNFNKYSKTSLKKIYNKLKEDYFEPDNIVINYLRQNLDSISSKDLPILNIDSIFAHCNKCYESIHICGEPLYNYKYYDLIICLKCKMIYKKNMIRLFCNSCNEEYYSYIVNESNYKNDFFPATWEKYHCFSFNYDQMPCPECASPLYYSELKKLLKCFKCNWISNPNKVLWECEICGKKFSSKIKEFVKYETKPEINCVKYALINRIDAKPYICKCCGENPININFFHPDCGGGYYLSYLQTKYVVVCNKCKTIFKPENVKWGCGNCKKNFLCDKMIVLESAIEKEITFGYRNENNNKLSNENKQKFMTSKKIRKYRTDITKEIKSQKLKFKPKPKVINERNKNDMNLNINKNLEKSLRTIEIKEDVYKSKFDKINKNFQMNNKDNLLNTTSECFKLKKNVSERRLDFKSYNRRNFDLNNNNNILIENKININKKKENDKKEKTKNNQEKENITHIKRRNIYKSQIKLEERDIKTEQNNYRIIKKENSTNIKPKEQYPIKEKNLKRLQTDKYPFSALDKINEKKDFKNRLKSNNNMELRYSRIRQNINTDKNYLKGQSQRKSSNIRLNFSVNININNILENKTQNKFNNNSIYSIKPEKILEPGENFNPNEFKIQEKIGFGSFGKIYNVLWIRNNKNYAMKIINLKHREDIDDAQKKLKIIQDFCKETNSPGIIKTYGNLYEKMGRNEYKYYILMELAETDWEQEINFRNKKNLFYSKQELFEIIKQLVTCYALLQKNNISHRDVKPQNVLILNGLYKLCDFGEARNISGKNGYIHQPIRGSELYMSPILFDALNNNELDVLHNSYKSDVFSLGMCIFLAATLSFDCLYEIREEKNMKNIKKILEKYLIPRYSRNLVNILYNMLQIDEDLRPNFIELEKIIFH